MALAERKANVVWEGDMRIGKGTVDAGSGAFGGLPIAFSDRVEPEPRSVTPEEFIASAHASCYAMALSNTLAANGNAPERLEITACCELDNTTDGLTIKRARLEVTGVVPRLDQESFVSMAEKADARCAVSNALRGSVEIEITARLA